jgi:hypothetical protein
VEGETTESIGAAIRGVAKEYASMFQSRETSEASRVRRLGATATSSKEYPRRASFDPPIVISGMF